jgi:hypothetical protein
LTFACRSSPKVHFDGLDSPISLNANRQSCTDSVRLSEVPDVEENQKILAAHLNRMKAADENLRRTTLLRNV